MALWTRTVVIYRSLYNKSRKPAPLKRKEKKIPVLDQSFMLQQGGGGRSHFRVKLRPWMQLDCSAGLVHSGCFYVEINRKINQHHLWDVGTGGWGGKQQELLWGEKKMKWNTLENVAWLGFCSLQLKGHYVVLEKILNIGILIFMILMRQCNKPGNIYFSHNWINKPFSGEGKVQKAVWRYKGGRVRRI